MSPQTSRAARAIAAIGPIRSTPITGARGMNSAPGTKPTRTIQLMAMATWLMNHDATTAQMARPAILSDDHGLTSRPMNHAPIEAPTATPPAWRPTDERTPDNTLSQAVPASAAPNAPVLPKLETDT